MEGGSLVKKKILRLKQGKAFAFRGGNLFEGRESIKNRKQIIETFLRENYTDPRLSAEMLAKQMNLSVRHMNRIVTQFYGVTFYQLLTGIRLDYAKKHLLTSKKTIKEIALSVGYESSTGFFVAFKKRYGMTPREFCQVKE